MFLLYYLMLGIDGKNTLLVLCSLLFYAYEELVYVFLMAGSIVVNYIFGRYADVKAKWARMTALYMAVIYNLGMLAMFKYADTLVGVGNALLHVEMKRI